MPDGLAGRFALLLAGALIAANLIALVILAVDRMDDTRRDGEIREIERIAALVPAMEAVAPQVRTGIARDASTRFARVAVEAEPRVTETAADARSRDLGRRVSETLGDRPVAVAVVAQPVRPDGQRDWHGRDAIMISIALSGAPAQWLNVVTSGVSPRGDGIPGGPILTVLGLSLAGVLAVALFFIRLLTRPLAALAVAARAAGHGDRTARVPETGAREVRTAAAAFNTMQTEIARFDAERMRMLAAVGHDLRTPMTSLRIRTEMVDDDALRAPMIRTLDEMTVMADGLVAFAREGREAEDSVAVDLACLLGRVCADRGAEFTGAAVTVRGRPVALGRLFGNLVDNARRYGGSAVVSLSVNGAEVRVHVDDTGPGIPPERLEDMFAPFTRGDDSRNADTGGAGLGLSIARSIAVAHGGRITLENRTAPENHSGGGLRATVILPKGSQA